jgi:hypothetical protein
VKKSPPTVPRAARKADDRTPKKAETQKKPTATAGQAATKEKKAKKARSKKKPTRYLPNKAAPVARGLAPDSP